MSPDKLVYMANQIGKFFASQGPEKAAAGTADHIKKFWDPRMRAAIFAHVEAGGAGLDPARPHSNQKSHGGQDRSEIKRSRQRRRTRRRGRLQRECPRGNDKQAKTTCARIKAEEGNNDCDGASASSGIFGFLDRSRTIAKPGFSRWMVPPAALCIHLCIGQAYAFSVFNLPMTKLIGISQSAPDDWKLTELGWIFSIAIFFLGASAAVCGRWVEEGGPRRAMFTSGLCWSVGFFISAIGVYVHNLWLIYHRLWLLRRDRPRPRLHFSGLDPDQVVSGPAGHGDRHGHHGLRRRRFHRLAALGLAHAELFDAHPCRRRRSLHRSRRDLPDFHVGRRSDRAHTGARLETGRLYAACCRAKADHESDVYVYDAIKTPQFWLIWLVLCLNVTAGIGVLGQASAMSQEMFPGKVSVVGGRGLRRTAQPVQHARAASSGPRPPTISAERTPTSASSRSERRSTPGAVDG